MAAGLSGRLRWLAGAACGFVAVMLLVWLAASGPAESRVFAAVSRPLQAGGLEHKDALDDPDQVCRSCHQAIYDAYEKTPMARGSGVALEGLDREELAAGGFLHDASGVRYRVTVRDGVATLGYTRAATAVRGGLEGEERLRYFVGSGRRGRTYLYEQDGLWFEAPINWYSKQGVWDMAPAYGEVTEMPAALPVDANCLHCHAGNVQVSVGGARNRFVAGPFRSGGVGCAACHGDGTAHLAAVKAAAVKNVEVKNGADAAILNPDRLDAVRRDSVCLQCHLEGDATVYLPRKSLARFKPGENLFEAAVYFVDRNRQLQGGRAGSQYEALLESACKRGAGDRLTCTTCHDPHSSPGPAERVEFFRGRCLSCHTGAAMATAHHPEQRDCATCHMPTRKTLDISHEQMTDHNIEARPRTGEPARRTKAFDLVPVGPARVGTREEGLAYAELAQHGDRTAGERALKLLTASLMAGTADGEVHDQLGFLLQVSGAAGDAGEQYRAALKEDPQDTTAAANLAVLAASRGEAGEAVRLLRRVVAEDPSQTAAGLNLAFLLCRMNDKAAATGVVKEMLRLHPDSGEARRFLAEGRYGGQSCPLQGGAGR